MKTLSNKVVAKNKWTTFVEEQFEIDSGRTGNYLIVERQPAIMIIPIIKKKEKYYTYLVRQYRYPISKKVWQFPMGTLEDNSLPIEHAKHELREETGLIAKDVKRVGEYYVDPGLTRQICKIFIAENIIEGGKQKLEQTEKGMTIKKISFENLKRMVENEELNDSWGYAGFLALKKYLDKRF